MKEPSSRAPKTRSVDLAIHGSRILGDLVIPREPQGTVVFAHGSGSSRFSPRNRYVAEQLQQSGLATLLLDLLTPEEEAVDMRSGHLRFDIEFLAERLARATDWLMTDDEMAPLPLGYFGASTGAAAALIAAAERPSIVRAVVSRGGRPDLARRSLELVQAPTLLIVGGNDSLVLRLNREALAQLHCEKELAVVPGATHLFEEPGALEQVAQLATGWFHRYLVRERRTKVA